MSEVLRRKLLKSIAAGSGAIVAGKSLPESWSRPVVDSVMLPVHAQTSIVANGAFAAAGVAQADDLLDVLVPKAQANNLPKNICINVTNGVASVQVQYGDPGPVYAGSGQLPFDLTLIPDDANKVSITGSLDPNTNEVKGQVTAGGSTTGYTASAISAQCSLSATFPAPVTYTFEGVYSNGRDVIVPIGATMVKITCVGAQGGGGGGGGTFDFDGFGGGGGGGGGASAVVRSGALIASANGSAGGNGGDGPSGAGSNATTGATTMTTVSVTGGETLSVRAALGGFGGHDGGSPGNGSNGSGEGSDGTRGDFPNGGTGGPGGVGSVVVGGPYGAGTCASAGAYNGLGGVAGQPGHCGASGSVTLEWL